MGYEHYHFVAEAIDRLWLRANGDLSAMPSDRIDPEWERQLTLISDDIREVTIAVRSGAWERYPHHAGRWFAALTLLESLAQEIAAAIGIELPRGRVLRDVASCRYWLAGIGAGHDAAEMRFWDAGYEIGIANIARVAPALLIAGESPVRIPVDRELRASVWDKSGGRCWYCGRQTNPFRDFHVDHAIPVVSGGSNDLDNLVPSCQPCNGAKGSLSLEEFRAYRGGALFWFEIVRGPEP